MNYADKLRIARGLPQHSVEDYKKKVEQLKKLKEQKRMKAEAEYNLAMTRRETAINDALKECKKIRAAIKEHREIFLAQLAFLEEQLAEAESLRDKLCAEPMPEFPKEILE